MRIYITSPGERLSNVARSLYGPKPEMAARLAELHKGCFMHNRTNPDKLYPYQALNVPYPDEFEKRFSQPSNSKTIVDNLNCFAVEERIKLKQIIQLGIDPQLTAAVYETNKDSDVSEKIKDILKELASQTVESLKDNGKEIESKFEILKDAFYSPKNTRGTIGNKYTASVLRPAFNEFSKEYENKFSLRISKKLSRLRQLKKYYYRNPNTFHLANHTNIDSIRGGIKITTKIDKGFTAWDLYNRSQKVLTAYNDGEDWKREMTIQSVGFVGGRVGRSAGGVVGGGICAIVGGVTAGLGAFVCVVIGSTAGSIFISNISEELTGIAYDHMKDVNFKFHLNTQAGPETWPLFLKLI